VADLSMARTAAMAAFAAGISAVFSLVASVVGVRGSASLDPANAGTASPARR